MYDPLKNDRPAKIYFGPLAFLHFFSEAQKGDSTFAQTYVRNVLIFGACIIGIMLLFLGCVLVMVFGGFFAVFTGLKSIEADHRARAAEAQQAVDVQPAPVEQQHQVQQLPAERTNEFGSSNSMNREVQPDSRVEELARLQTLETELQRSIGELTGVLSAGDFPVTVQGKEYADDSQVQAEIDRLTREKNATGFKIAIVKRRLETTP